VIPPWSDLLGGEVAAVRWEDYEVEVVCNFVPLGAGEGIHAARA
jgi:hypothetical protein